MDGCRGAGLAVRPERLPSNLHQQQWHSEPLDAVENPRGQFSWHSHRCHQEHDIHGLSEGPLWVQNRISSDSIRFLLSVRLK